MFGGLSHLKSGYGRRHCVCYYCMNVARLHVIKIHEVYMYIMQIVPACPLLLTARYMYKLTHVHMEYLFRYGTSMQRVDTHVVCICKV